MDINRILRSADFGAAVVFLACGSAGLLLSNNLASGTILRMGPGYLPRLMSLVVIFFGVLTLLISLFKSNAQAISGIRIRPVVAILAAIGMFGLTIERLGLPLAVFIMVVVAGLGSRDLRKTDLLLAAALLAILSTLLFVYLLDLSIPWRPRMLVG